MIARTYLEPLRVRPLRDVAPLSHRVIFRQPLNVGLTQFWRDQIAEEKRFHVPAYIALLVGIAAMLIATAWEGAHIDGTLRGAVAVFDRQAVPAATVCETPDRDRTSAEIISPQRISNPNAVGLPSLPSIPLKFGILLP
jgi:hypothetical protein